ncbi:MAG: type IV toxin-antitoxin system AbiEi family antitoxin domain-containing protein [Terriglobales bacterium]
MRYVGKHGIVRPRDIEAIGLPREYLVRLHRQGKLNRPGRGIYTLPDANGNNSKRNIQRQLHFTIAARFRWTKSSPAFSKTLLVSSL